MTHPTLGAVQQTFEYVTNRLRLSHGRMSPHMLEILAAPFDCEWATYWRADANAGVLRAHVRWTKPGIHPTELEKDTNGRYLSLSEGVAGQVWRDRAPVWTTDLVTDMCLPRSLDAKAAGFRRGIWFAVQSESTVYGVVELLGQRIEPATRPLMLAIEQYGFDLGHVMSHTAYK